MPRKHSDYVSRLKQGGLTVTECTQAAVDRARAALRKTQQQIAETANLNLISLLMEREAQQKQALYELEYLLDEMEQDE